METITTKAAELQARWRDDFDLYCLERFGVVVTPAQRAAANAARLNHRSAWASGHKTGRTLGVVLIGLWLAEVHDYDVLFASPNLRGGLWNLVRRVLLSQYGKGVVGEALRWAHPPYQPSTGVVSPISGRALRGFGEVPERSCDPIVFARTCLLVDDVRDMEDDVVVVMALLPWRVALFDVPVAKRGVFYDAFHDAAAGWATTSTSSWDNPAISGLATPEWCEHIKKQWGPDTDRYLARVLGRFAADTPS